MSQNVFVQLSCILLASITVGVLRSGDNSFRKLSRSISGQISTKQRFARQAEWADMINNRADNCMNQCLTKFANSIDGTLEIGDEIEITMHKELFSNTETLPKTCSAFQSSEQCISTCAYFTTHVAVQWNTVDYICDQHYTGFLAALPCLVDSYREKHDEACDRLCDDHPLALTWRSTNEECEYVVCFTNCKSEKINGLCGDGSEKAADLSTGLFNNRYRKRFYDRRDQSVVFDSVVPARCSYILEAGSLSSASTVIQSMLFVAFCQLILF